MTVVRVPKEKTTPRAESSVIGPESSSVRAEAARALGWFAAALALRVPLLARAGGLLDHDQATVNLMAMDIASGLRWPIFFDGQRYMGALEPYTAALFVRLLGHTPTAVAMAPAFYFALFAAGQYLIWRCWADRTTGHLAALLTVACAPLLTIWSVLPRGGYTVLLAWALPTLWAYRHLTRPGAVVPSRRVQFGWGFLLAIGYYFNPLALVVYATLALDWALGRHGDDLRRSRRWLEGRWLDSPRAVWGWLGLAVLMVLGMGLACHVVIDPTRFKGDFIFLLGLVPGPIGALAGLTTLGTILALGLWGTGLAPLMIRRVREHPWFGLGVLCAMTPHLIYLSRTWLGWQPQGGGVMMWLRAPWSIGPHLQQGLPALGALIGCDASEAMASHRLMFAELSMPEPTSLTQTLATLSPAVLAVAAALILAVTWSDRRAWSAFWSLRGTTPSRPTMLAIMGLAITVALYTFQCSGNGLTAARYLVPLWIFLPGLLASGLRACPVGLRVAAAGLLVVPWLAAQGAVWAASAEPIAPRVLAEELDRRGVEGIVAPKAVALHVVNFTSGRVGAAEFQSFIPRIGDRYQDRFDPAGPVLCVVDRGGRWPPVEDLGRHLEDLDRRHPGRVRLAWTLGRFEVWEVDLPLRAVLEPETSAPLLLEGDSGKVSGASNPPD